MFSLKVSFRERVARFFYGRNGADTLANAVMILALALTFLNMILQSMLLSLLVLGLLIYFNFRMLSKNLWKRQQENRAFQALLGRLRRFFSLQRSRWRDRKTHIYRTCPHCKRTLRLPRTKGEHTVCCPCCYQRFQVKV